MTSIQNDWIYQYFLSATLYKQHGVDAVSICSNSLNYNFPIRVFGNFPFLISISKHYKNCIWNNVPCIGVIDPFGWVSKKKMRQIVHNFITQRSAKFSSIAEELRIKALFVFGISIEYFQNAQSLQSTFFVSMVKKHISGHN